MNFLPIVFPFLGFAKKKTNNPNKQTENKNKK